ncbi:MAG: hypothetical protein A2664_02490 [Candidatus Taylorbacteria bacterium RIFCSPHIGHO2_01_FULL_46_22b]|uniref:Uncharacterized protein n=1 Tax=Candidatus Taylorbacteria bacterium RIFCSPHIGHO2_01_FULL_46_22b TaxID=1802301 RepID=A0A1G2M372_9BACT|nr:MAG: hypothetical protein A2664_02490 [Candidatus Taylorbacteria bacterium RIFCSPHIGHO2_01_FULL_46_22b]
MNSSKWPHWVKGGVISLIFYVPFIFVQLLGQDSALILWPLTVPMWPVIWLLGLPYAILGINMNLPLQAQQIILFLVAIIIGTGLGSVYGKLVKRKSPPQV